MRGKGQSRGLRIEPLRRYTKLLVERHLVPRRRPGASSFVRVVHVEPRKQGPRTATTLLLLVPPFHQNTGSKRRKKIPNNRRKIPRKRARRESKSELWRRRGRISAGIGGFRRESAIGRGFGERRGAERRDRREEEVQGK